MAIPPFEHPKPHEYGYTPEQRRKANREVMILMVGFAVVEILAILALHYFYPEWFKSSACTAHTATGTVAVRG